MKKLTSLLLFLSAFGGMTQAQELIDEYELDYIYKYSAYELEDVDPDSVFGFYEYGSVYSPEDFTDDDEQLTTDLLNCRNLQVLELHNIAAGDVLSQLDRFPKLQWLILDNVGIPNVPDGIYSLQYLKKLNLSYFTELNLDGTRIQAEDVHDLEFSYNTLRCDSGECELPLSSFPAITRLVLKGELYYLPSQLYSCTQLIELDISDCNLEEVGYGIGDLENLEILSLARNYSLTDLPEEIGYLQNLRSLDISGSGFYTLPYGLAECVNIDYIDASYSSLEEIPDFIGNLSQLYSLNLSGCTSISTLPSELKNCEYLSSMNLYGCGFYDIPQVIGQIPGLTDLDMSYNYITVVPRHLGGAKNLLALDLSGNNIEKFEPGCGDMSSLYKLKLSSCGLNNLSPEIFRLTNLEQLDLSYDSLTELPAGLYALTKLTSLYADNNLIKTVAKGISKLTALNDLNLSNNPITALPKDFTGCVNLGYLTLADNKLKKFPKGMGKLTNLMYLDVRGNKDIVFKKEFGLLKDHIYEIKLRPEDISTEALTKLRALVGEEKVYLSEY